MGGFGAIKIGLSHPDRFAFVGALSPAIDVTRRRFSAARIQQFLAFRSIFGPEGSITRERDDPFFLARSMVPATAPYLYLGCGDRESLLAPNREFDKVLMERHLAHEFHIAPGGHDWEQWNGQVPKLFETLRQLMGGAN